MSRYSETAPLPERRCTLCKNTKPIEQFVKAANGRGRGGFTYVCKPCQNDCNLRRKFGITREDYDAMFLAQGGLCAICRKPGGRRRLAVDHNHVTGEVRGLLCNGCNLHVAAVENHEWLAAAEHYLLAGKEK